MKSSRPSFRPAAFAGLLVILTAAANATTYYVDPATGSMSNPGTAASPWSTLADVFTANKTFAAGDEILLRSGFHGAPIVKGHNTASVAIRPESTSAAPTVIKLIVRNGSHWNIAGLDISPENASPAVYSGDLVGLEGTAHHITVRNCRLRSTFQNPHTWALADWSKARKGFAVSAPYTQLIENDLEVTSFSIDISKGATNSLVSRNRILHFSMDAIRGRGDDCVYEYNYAANSYVSDDNHDDFFQSWSTDAEGTVGAGVVRNVTVRGNVFISQTDTAQPLQKAPQGIGCFDGMFENWIIENNVISSQTYHGIALYGAINCKITNNIAVENAVRGSTTVKPWVRIYDHKDGTASTGNLIRNNISSASASMPTGAGVRDHNLTTTAYSTYFANYAGFDFYPVPTSPAINTGEATDAPSIDVLGNPRTAPYDVGAYEFQTEVIVDNTNPVDFEKVGSWTSSTANAGYYGIDYLHDENTGKGSKTATFNGALGTGTYAVYLRWTAGTNRASNLPVTTHHAAGSNTATINQRLNGGVWWSLGTYTFQTHQLGKVVLSNTGTNGHVIADAVRFVRQ